MDLLFFYFSSLPTVTGDLPFCPFAATVGLHETRPIPAASLPLCLQISAPPLINALNLCPLLILNHVQRSQIHAGKLERLI